MNCTNIKKEMQAIRGYKKLKTNNCLRRLVDTQNALKDANPDVPTNKVSSILFKNNANNLNDIAKQYLFLEIGGVSLNKVLLQSINGKESGVAYPLPKHWQKILIRQGWKISKIKSSTLWHIKLLTNLSQGVAYFFKILFSFFQKEKNKKQIKENFIYFCDLGSNSYFSPDIGPKSHNLIAWYLQWPGRNQKANVISHNVLNTKNIKHNEVTVKYSDLFMVPKKKLKFTIKSLYAIFNSFLGLCRGNWWAPFLLKEIIKDLHFQNQEHIALEYWFHNGSPARPLWSYSASQIGAKINYYFFATNTENIKTKNGDDILAPLYRSMTWDHYLVWDEEQSNFLQRCGVSKKNFQIVGPICAYDSSEPLPKWSGKSIAVFDVPPRRMSAYVTLGLPVEYYVASTCIQFLQDIFEVAMEQSLVVLWKGKRNLSCSSLFSKSYLNKIKNLQKEKRFITVDPRIAAQRVIQQSCLTISLPFTSPSLIAKQYTKPACFYDPTQSILKDVPAARGIPVVSGKEELRQFLAKIE